MIDMIQAPLMGAHHGPHSAHSNRTHCEVLVSGNNIASLALFVLSSLQYSQASEGSLDWFRNGKVNMIYFGADGIVMVGSFLLYSTQGLDDFISSFIFQ